MRDVLIKSSAMGFSKTAVISEVKGNPSSIKIFGPEGDTILTIDLTVSNSLSSGKIRKDKLRIKWEIDDYIEDLKHKNTREQLKEKFNSLMEIPEYEDMELKDNIKIKLKKQTNYQNLILIKKEEKESKLITEFYDEQGQITGPRIYIHQCKWGAPD